MTDTIPARLAALKSTPTADLKVQWRDLFDSEPPPFNRRYLENRLAYRIQELAYGGLKPETIRRLEGLGEELLAELDNPSPSHKVRSEFLATMAFAHLMTPEQIQTVLDSRIQDAEENLRIIDEFESGSDRDWPAGVRFTLGFGRTMLHAMKTYVEENRDMFETEVQKKTVAR